MSQNEPKELKSGSILARLANTIESLAELRVVTVVGDVRIALAVNKDDKDVTAFPVDVPDGVPGAFSEINLISGDIITAIHTDFAAEDNAVQKLHIAQVESGRSIVRDNVNTITRLAQSATGGLASMLNANSRSSGD